jgi:serine/threonine protein kinase
MFKIKDDIQSVKIIDFGLSTKDDVDFENYLCGTPGYIAPEILNGE